MFKDLQTLDARVCGRGFEPFEREIVDEQRDEFNVVVDDEDFRRTCVHKKAPEN